MQVLNLLRAPLLLVEAVQFAYQEEAHRQERRRLASGFTYCAIAAGPRAHRRECYPNGLPALSFRFDGRNASRGTSKGSEVANG